jgi:hypothetical protein
MTDVTTVVKSRAHIDANKVNNGAELRDSTEALFHLAQIPLRVALEKNYSPQKANSRAQKAASKLISIAARSPVYLTGLYPRALIDSVPRDGKDALLKLLDEFSKNPKNLDEIVSGIKQGVDNIDNINIDTFTPAFTVGYCIGKIYYYNSRPQEFKDTSNKFRVRMTGENLSELNDIIDLLKIDCVDQTGGYTGWHAALANRFGIKFIVPVLQGLCENTYDKLIGETDRKSIIQRSDNGNKDTNLKTVVKRSPRNLPINVNDFSLDAPRINNLTNLFNRAGISQPNFDNFGNVKVNPTIVAKNDSVIFDPPNWVYDEKYDLDGGVLIPIGEKLDENWSDALKHLLEKSSRPFVLGSWSGKVDEASLVNTQRKNPKTKTTYLCSFNADEITSALDILNENRQLLDTLLGNLVDNRNPENRETIFKLIDLYSVENSKYPKLVYATHALRLILNADHISCRTLDAVVTSYDPDRFPNSIIFRSLSYIGSMIARFTVNKKLESTDPYGLPEESLSEINLKAKIRELPNEEIMYSVGKIRETHVMHDSNFIASLKNRLIHLFDQNLNKQGIYNLDYGFGVIAVTPLPRASSLNSPEIGVGDTSDFFKGTLLNLVYLNTLKRERRKLNLKFQ